MFPLPTVLQASNLEIGQRSDHTSQSTGIKTLAIVLSNLRLQTALTRIQRRRIVLILRRRGHRGRLFFLPLKKYFHFVP
jgi:hypothetical protein